MHRVPRPFVRSAPARRARGVTLLELMVAVALLAGLATLALPGYRAQLLRAHRTEATRTLLALALAQERHHLRHGLYAARLGAGGTPMELDFPPVSDGGRYRLAIEHGDAAGFLATAAASGAQAVDAACARFTLDHAGHRAASTRAGIDATERCWR